MKVFKELPKSIYYTLLLRSKSIDRLTKNKEVLPVIVSFTSIKTRLNTLDIVIKGMLNQKFLPEKIVLWLNEDLKSELPSRLKKISSDLFEIRYSGLDCPHLKLVESLKYYPNDIIVTCDDDLIYLDNHLKKLYDEHLKQPDKIVANRTVQIKFNEKGNYIPYNEWKKKEAIKNNKMIMPLGVSGVLYPPKVFSKEVLDSKLFLKLSPKADDLWFKCMSLLNNTGSLQVVDKPRKPIPIIGSQKVSLKKENVNKNKNDIQWKALSDHFNLKVLLQSKKNIF